MNKVYACIDQLPDTAAVVDWAAWSALRLAVPLEILHMLERGSNGVAAGDHSGAIGLGAQESLLQELSERDASLARLAQEAGRTVLDAARERASAAGVVQLDARMRHGDLIDGVMEMQADARLFVLGKHLHVGSHARIHLDYHLEQVVRAVHRPVLAVTGGAFAAPTKVAIAYDGSATARKAVAAVAASHLLAGIPILVAMAATESTTALAHLEEARTALAAAGLEVVVELVAGAPGEVLPPLMRARGIDLLVMGAYGHSRVRQLIVGSTTTALLRLSEVPVLVLR